MVDDNLKGELVLKKNFLQKDPEILIENTICAKRGHKLWITKDFFAVSKKNRQNDYAIFRVSDGSLFAEINDVHFITKE